MSSEEALTRRQVLVLLGAGGALALGGVGLVARRDDGKGPGSGVELEPALVALGEAVLARHPTILDEGGSLGDGVDRAAVLDEPVDGLRALQDRIRADHAAGRVLDVDGWVLSRTECYLAAVYARG